jgi:hypothetical protein
MSSALRFRPCSTSAPIISSYSRGRNTRSCAVFLLQDLDTQRVYRLYDFTKARKIQPGVAYCIAGKINSADKLYLVIESVRPDTRHAQYPTVPVPPDGAGG